jgi:hypothetical protein
LLLSPQDGTTGAEKGTATGIEPPPLMGILMNAAKPLVAVLGW